MHQLSCTKPIGKHSIPCISSTIHYITNVMHLCSLVQWDKPGCLRATRQPQMMILYLKRSYFKHGEEAGDVRPRCKQMTLVTLHMTGKVNAHGNYKWGYILEKQSFELNRATTSQVENTFHIYSVNIVQFQTSHKVTVVTYFCCITGCDAVSLLLLQLGTCFQ